MTASCTGDEDRVPHISLVFREMWDTTVPDVRPCPLPLGAMPGDLQFHFTAHRCLGDQTNSTHG